MLSDLGAMRVASEMHRQHTWAGCQSQKVSMATTSFRSPVRTRTLRLQRALQVSLDSYSRGQHAVLRIVSKSTVRGLGFGLLEVACDRTAIISSMRQAETHVFNLHNAFFICDTCIND